MSATQTNLNYSDIFTLPVYLTSAPKLGIHGASPLMTGADPSFLLCALCVLGGSKLNLNYGE